MTDTKDKPFQLTPEHMRAWEDRLGPDKVELAMALARSHGWHSGDDVPMWVWAQFYRMAEGSQPIEWGTSAPQRLDESLLGMRLF